MKRDILANLYQKCLILCSEILLNVLFNTSLTVLLPWQHTGFQTSPYLKLFWPPLRFHFIFLNSTSYAWSSKHIDIVSSCLWPCLTFSKLKITSLLKSSGTGDWKRMRYHGNEIFYSHRCVSCRTISLPSFNVLHCKLAKITPFICLI